MTGAPRRPPPPGPGPRDARPASREPRNAQPLTERELTELQAMLDDVPAPLEALDVSMLDGYLCGVLLQPRPVPVARWLPHTTDVDGRPLPARFDATRLTALVLRRHAELDDAIGRRQWFDPWVFELSDAAGEPHDGDEGVDEGVDEESDDEASDEGAPVDAVYPWVAGFATALELFPDLMALDAKALTEPLALVYRHLAPDDLEEADELLAEIESLEPPQDLTEAVEGLVRATLLLADISRSTSRPMSPAIRRSGPPPPGAPRRPRPSNR